MKKKLLFLILFIIIPLIIFGDSKYSFSKVTWSKGVFLSAGTISVISLINGLYLHNLSDKAYEDYKKASSESYSTSYRISSDYYNSQSTFWKNVSIYSGLVALTSAGLDYFIFGRIQSNVKLYILDDNQPGIGLIAKF